MIDIVKPKNLFHGRWKKVQSHLLKDLSKHVLIMLHKLLSAIDGIF